jgi:adenylate cyclase 10
MVRGSSFKGCQSVPPYRRCVRNEKWEAASLWCLKTGNFLVLTENDSLANKITALYLLEGLIVFLVNKLDKRNIEAVLRAEYEIKFLFTAIEKAARTTRMILPRWVLCFLID